MEKFIKNKKIIIFLIIVGGVVLSFGAFAAEKKLQVSWPPSPAGTSLTPDSTLPDLVKYLYEWGIALGGLAVFIALIIAGFQYLTSVGDPTKMKEAIDRIKSAVFGLVLLLGSWLILNTISPQFITFPPLALEPPTSFITPYQPCSIVEDCCVEAPDDQKEDCLRMYKCEDNFCISQWQSMEPCESVELGGTDIITSLNSNECQPTTDQGVIVQAGRSFSASSTPAKCAGVLQLFGKPNCEDMRAAVDVNVKNYTVDADIKSLLLSVSSQ